jgi:hypothetical protein
LDLLPADLLPSDAQRRTLVHWKFYSAWNLARSKEYVVTHFLSLRLLTTLAIAATLTSGTSQLSHAREGEAAPAQISSDQVSSDQADGAAKASPAEKTKKAGAAKSRKSVKAKAKSKAKSGSPAVKNPDAQYVRIREEDKEPQALETAIVRFVAAPGSKYEGRIVDLVGVVHIGQLEYYKDLNSRLSKYDVVLYELVAPDGTRIRPQDLEERRSILASMQTGMKDMLNLEYQLEHIDYMAKNFRHADMSPDEFMEDMASRGDGLWKMAARMMGAGLATQAANGGDAGMLMALFSTDRSKALKQVMAKQLTDVEAVTAGMDDETGDNTLIKGRNRKAFEVLRKELDAGKKTVAVFYGAGHLNDMAERLERDFGFKPTTTTWLAAWDLQRN